MTHTIDFRDKFKFHNFSMGPDKFLEHYKVSPVTSIMFDSLCGRYCHTEHVNYIMSKMKNHKNMSIKLALFIYVNCDTHKVDDLLFIWEAIVRQRTEKLKIWPIISVNLIYKLFLNEYHYPPTLLNQTVLEYAEHASDGKMNLLERWFTSFGCPDFSFISPVIRHLEWFKLAKIYVKRGTIDRPRISYEVLELARNIPEFYKKIVHQEFLTAEQYASFIPKLTLDQYDLRIDYTR